MRILTTPAGPQAPTLTNGGPSSQLLDPTGNTREFRQGSGGASCGNQDGLGQQDPARHPEAYLVPSRGKDPAPGLSTLGSDRPGPSVKGEREELLVKTAKGFTESDWRETHICLLSVITVTHTSLWTIHKPF